MKAVLIIHILDIHTQKCNIMYNFILHHNFEQHFAYTCMTKTNQMLIIIKTLTL